MTPQQPTPQSPKLDWSQPDPRLDERELARYLSAPLSVEHLQGLLVSNMLAVQDAYDRRVTGDNFNEILINAMNFNNFMSRTAMMQEVEAALMTGELSTTWVKERILTMRERADSIRNDVIETLRLLRECRQRGEPVS